MNFSLVFSPSGDILKGTVTFPLGLLGLSLSFPGPILLPISLFLFALALEPFPSRLGKVSGFQTRQG